MLKLVRLNKKKYNLKRCIKCMHVYDCLYKVMMRMNMRVLKKKCSYLPHGSWKHIYSHEQHQLA